MPSQKTTPEEKLFAVIQGAAHPSPRAKAQALSFGSMTLALQGLLQAVDLPRVNQALVVAIALLGACILVTPLLMQPNLDRLVERAAKQTVPFVIAPPLEGVKTTEDYVSLMRVRDPFGMGELPPPAAAVNRSSEIAPPGAPGTDVQTLLADLRLVGISRGIVTTAMIEQISQNKTTILKVGDQIDQFTITDILSDRVILQVGAGPEEVDLF